VKKRYLVLLGALAVCVAFAFAQNGFLSGAYFVNPTVLGTLPMCEQFSGGLCVYEPSGLVDNGTMLTYKGTQVATTAYVASPGAITPTSVAASGTVSGSYWSIPSLTGLTNGLEYHSASVVSSPFLVPFTQFADGGASGVGSGSGWTANIPTTTTNTLLQGEDYFVATNDVTATATTDKVIKTMNAGTLQTSLTIKGNGNLQFNSVTLNGGSSAMDRCSGGTSDGFYLVAGSTAATTCTSGGGTLVSTGIAAP
jgi:hypothetical protein